MMSRLQPVPCNLQCQVVPKGEWWAMVLLPDAHLAHSNMPLVLQPRKDQ